MKNRKIRGNSRFFIFFIVLILIGGFGVYYIFNYFKNVEFLNIKRIEITGNTNLEDNFLLDLANEFIGRNIFEVSRQEIGNKYSNLVRVKSVKIRRFLPNTLKLIFTENTGKFYLISKNGNIYPISEEKIVLDSANFYLNEDLPLIHTDLECHNFEIGMTIKDDFVELVVDIFKRLEKFNLDLLVSEFYRSKGDVHAVEYYTGTVLVLNKQNLENNLPRLGFYIDNKGFDNRTFINLKYDNQIIISEVR